MKKQIVLVFILTALLEACAGTVQNAAPATSPASSALDGRTYEVLLEIPDSPATKDTLRFSGGRFESTACTALGFPEWADYLARASGDQVAFQATAQHPSGTTMEWSGHIRGDAVDGTANRTMNGKTDVIRFKGLLSH
jgi:hypothetical protein